VQTIMAFCFIVCKYVNLHMMSSWEKANSHTMKSVAYIEFSGIDLNHLSSEYSSFIVLVCITITVLEIHLQIPLTFISHL